jgi:hypothetical protein
MEREEQEDNPRCIEEKWGMAGAGGGAVNDEDGVEYIKVMINKCYGGFSVSLRALIEYHRLKDQPLYFYKDLSHLNPFSPLEEQYERITEDEALEIDALHQAWHLSTIPIEESGDVNEGFVSQYNWGDHGWDISNRADPVMIEVVEALGKAANGRCANIEVVEIPSDIEWYIDDYDGIETIHEPHRSW